MIGWLLCIALCGAPLPGAEAAPPAQLETIEIIAGDDPTRVVVRSVLTDFILMELGDKPVTEAAGRRLLTLRLIDETSTPSKEGPPLFGTYERRGDVLSFTPKFALGRGSKYVATAYLGIPERLGATNCILWGTHYRVPEAKAATPPTVERIAPSAEVLPANLLKFGIVFSRPMREGREVFAQIRLFDAQGKEIAAPWRDIELWNEDATVLSLYIHPGRIKQGVNLREDFGPVLRPNESYTLVVDGAMRDSAGLPLGREFRKTFKAGPEVRSKVDPANWKISVPTAGTRDSVLIEFDRVVDWYRGGVGIFGPADQPVFGGGGYFAEGSGSKYKFQPKEVWASGTYRLVIDPKTTDLAGNTPHTVFDRDLDDRSHDPSEGPIERTFTIR